MKPSRKVVTAGATALVLYVLSQFTTVDKDLEQLVNVVVPIAVAYFVPNPETSA